MPDSIFNEWLNEARRDHHRLRGDQGIDVQRIVELVAEPQMFNIKIIFKQLQLRAQPDVVFIHIVEDSPDKF